MFLCLEDYQWLGVWCVWLADCFWVSLCVCLSVYVFVIMYMYICSAPTCVRVCDKYGFPYCLTKNMSLCPLRVHGHASVGWVITILPIKVAVYICALMPVAPPIIDIEKIVAQH